MQRWAKRPSIPSLHWPRGERPWGKRTTRGTGDLSNAKLLAILLRTGTHGKTAFDLARGLFAEFAGLPALLKPQRRQSVSPMTLPRRWPYACVRALTRRLYEAPTLVWTSGSLPTRLSATSR